jgi:hypothetical protein
MRTATSPAAQQVTFPFVFIKPKSNDRSISQQTCGLAECKTTFIVWRQQVIMEVFVEVLCSIYVGESKIIRTIGTCFAGGYTAGWAWQNTHGLLLSHHCGAGVTLIVHFCHELFFFCHKHGHSQFRLHQRRAEGSDLFLWAEGVPGVEKHRMMSVQYGNSVMSQRIVC